MFGRIDVRRRLGNLIGEFIDLCFVWGRTMDKCGNVFCDIHTFFLPWGLNAL